MGEAIARGRTAVVSAGVTVIVPGTISVVAAMPGIGNVHVIIAADGERPEAGSGDMLQSVRSLRTLGNGTARLELPQLWDVKPFRGQEMVSP